MAEVAERIREKLRTVPHKPGIYLMKDRLGTVIYVGKARDLRKRVSQYFQPSRRLGWDLKFRALVEAICDLDFHTVRSEPEALLLEGKLIKEFHPRYNISFRDDKRFLLLKVNLNDPIPRFTLTRLKQEDGARYFGPFPNSGALRSTLALVRRQYHLRGCRPLTPDERDYKHCLYAHLKYCTAPCIRNVTRDQYLDQVRAACDFLAGQCEEMHGQLMEEMKKAAAAQEYERAAELRDLLHDLERTTRKGVNRFERVPYSLPMQIDPEKDLAELAEVLGLTAPPERIEGFDISNISGTFKVASLVSFRRGRPDRSNYRRFKIKTVQGQDDFASVAEVIRRRYTRVLKEGNVAAKTEGAPARAEESHAIDPSAKERTAPPPVLPSPPEPSEEEIPSHMEEKDQGIGNASDTLAGTGNSRGESANFPHRPLSERELREDRGEPVPRELQRAIDDVSAAAHHRPQPSPNTDAAAADVRDRRAPGVRPVKGAPGLPDLILIDGGKGQLSAACHELEKLGLSGVPIIGLAKEFEEIHRPGFREPLRLPQESGALKLLQRVRDESHRLANTYNAELRLRKISESILDEFPSIGERRKAALLKKFGSVQRIRLATTEQIAEVPGFGGKAAAELKTFLEARSNLHQPV